MRSIAKLVRLDSSKVKAAVVVKTVVLVRLEVGDKRVRGATVVAFADFENRVCVFWDGNRSIANWLSPSRHLRYGVLPVVWGSIQSRARKAGTSESKSRSVVRRVAPRTWAVAAIHRSFLPRM